MIQMKFIMTVVMIKYMKNQDRTCTRKMGGRTKSVCIIRNQHVTSRVSSFRRFMCTSHAEQKCRAENTNEEIESVHTMKVII